MSKVSVINIEVCTIILYYIINILMANRRGSETLELSNIMQIALYNNNNIALTNINIESINIRELFIVVVYGKQGKKRKVIVY